MVDVTQTGCINHPNMPAVNRCKQCSKPTCHKCTVVGPTGKFCSDQCSATHQAFIQRAQALETRARGTFFVKVRGFISTLLFLAVVCLAAGVVSTVFYIPVLTDLTHWVRRIIGI